MRNQHVLTRVWVRPDGSWAFQSWSRSWMLAVIEKARRDYFRRKTWVYLWIDSGNFTRRESRIAIEFFCFVKLLVVLKYIQKVQYHGMKCKATTVRHPISQLVTRTTRETGTSPTQSEVVAITSNNLKGQMTPVLPHHDLLCPINQMRLLAFVLHFDVSSHTKHNSYQGK